MRNRLFTVLLVILGLGLAFAAYGETDFEKKLKIIRIPIELDFKGTPLSDVLGNISKSTNIPMVATSEVADLRIDLYLPANQTLDKVIETIRKTSGLVSTISNDTIYLSKVSATTSQVQIRYGQVIGKATEIDKLTGIKGVTLSLGDDMNTLVMSDVGGAFIISNIEPGTYILKAAVKGYSPNAEIVEVKPGEDTRISIVLNKIGIQKPTGTEADANSPGKIQKDNGDIRVTKTVEVVFADPKEVREVVVPIIPLDNIVIDVKGNNLILMGSEDNINTAINLIKKLDVATQQIKIKATIWDLNKTNANELGLKWDIRTKPGDYEFDGKAMYDASGITLEFGDFTSNALKTSLNILSSINEASIMAEPFIVTLNGEKASLAIVNEEIVGSSEVANKDGTSSKTPLFKSAGIILEVTPFIKSDKTILLQISTKVSNFAKDGVYNNGATEKKSETSTKVRVKNGDTIRIGGLKRKDMIKTMSKVPVLGDMPIIGAAFQNTSYKEIDKDLYVELTAQIVD